MSLFPKKVEYPFNAVKLNMKQRKLCWNIHNIAANKSTWFIYRCLALEVAYAVWIHRSRNRNI